jgi:hypothetical protein
MGQASRPVLNPLQFDKEATVKKLLLLGVSIALLRVPGSAAPCVTGTLASYIAMPSAGCELGNLTFSNFAYQAKAGGGAAEITADQITVTPMVVPVGTFALQFAAPWGVETGQSQGSNITYRVLSSNPSLQVEQVRLDGNGFQAGMFGSVVVNEAWATPAATRGLEVYLKCVEVCRSQTSAELNLTPPPGALVVADRVTLQSKLGAAALTGFTDWFVLCIPCV